MKIGQLLDSIRNLYLTQFRQSISEAQGSGMKTWCEPAYRNQEGRLLREGKLNLPMRMDLVGAGDSSGTEIIRVDSAACHSFVPVEFEWCASLIVHLAPFHWDACCVRVSGLGDVTDWDRVVCWFEKWFDGEDVRPAGGDGLYGVVHFLSDPRCEGGVTVLEVDFGTAPVEAFEELLDVFRALGAVKVEVGVD